MDRPAVGRGEHEAVVVAPAGAHPLLELLPAPRPQHGDGPWVEVDRAPAVRRLHVGDVGAVLDRQDLLVDDEPGGVEVDVAPRAGRAPRRVACRCWRRGRSARTTRCPRCRRGTGAARRLTRSSSPSSRRARTFGGSARSATLRVTVPLRMRVGERLADDAVDDPHRLRREPAAGAVAAPVDEQLRVERVEVLGLQLLQRDRADARVDVDLDVVPVRARTSTAAAAPSSSAASAPGGSRRA